MGTSPTIAIFFALYSFKRCLAAVRLDRDQSELTKCGAMHHHTPLPRGIAIVCVSAGLGKNSAVRLKLAI